MKYKKTQKMWALILSSGEVLMVTKDRSVATYGAIYAKLGGKSLPRVVRCEVTIK